MTKKDDLHPYGTTLLSRDKPENRAQWGPQGVGYQPVAPTVCTADQCPHYHYKEDNTPPKALETPIHLLIASFRDQLCPRTLHNAFRRAENPGRIFIRVIEQTLADSDLIDDAGCFARYCADYNPDCQELEKQVRTVHVDAQQSKGPTDARSKLSAMVHWDYVHRHQPSRLDFQPIQLQDFCMQTDSHMDFSDHYDTDLIAMFHRAANDYAVLSTYVADIAQNNQDVRVVPNLCMVEFRSTIRNWGTKECRRLVRPKLTNAMWGAGLSFHRCHAELVVPVDPYLDQVFDGEEGSRGIRFFTHGYDVYTPDRVLVTHDYKKHQSNPIVHSWGGKLLRRGRKHNNNNNATWAFTEEIEEARSDVKIVGTKRVNMLLGIGSGTFDEEEVERARSGRFGLGTKRTLEQAIEFTGIDLRNKKMVENKCGNLVWVPFDESSDYGISEALSRGVAGGLASSTDTEQRSAALNAPPELNPDRRTTSLSVSAIGGPVLAILVLFKLVSVRKKKQERHTN